MLFWNFPNAGIIIPMTQNNITIAIFEFIVLIFSAVLHEVAHGYEADRLGDDTARRAGRLTLNPLNHMDFFGSFLLPLSLFVMSGGAFFFAAAKPVPYDPRNLRDSRSGGAKIAIAGPATNLVLAAIFGIIMRIFSYFLIPIPALFPIIVYLNILLAVFNSVPIPPLDGSRVLFAVLPQNETTFRIGMFFEQYGMFFVLLFVFFGFEFLIPMVSFFFTLLTGQPF